MQRFKDLFDLLKPDRRGPLKKFIIAGKKAMRRVTLRKHLDVIRLHLKAIGGPTQRFFANARIKLCWRVRERSYPICINALILGRDIDADVAVAVGMSLTIKEPLAFGCM